MHSVGKSDQKPDHKYANDDLILHSDEESNDDVNTRDIDSIAKRLFDTNQLPDQIPMNLPKKRTFKEIENTNDTLNANKAIVQN